MRIVLILAALLGGCGTGAETGNTGNAADEAAPAAARNAVQTATLTGLYEGGGGQRPSQLCIVDGGAGDARFGLVVSGGGDHSCSGAGAAAREDSVLRLAMEGDEPCDIQAGIDGARVTFPAALPSGCAYYCGARASMAGAEFVKVGGTVEAAMTARDLVGEPLCG